MDGIIVINKPMDFTSFDVVAVMRRVAGERKAGHTGTLDPMATGVLPLLFGNATKAQSLLPDSDKEYLAHFRLGITTDTLDITGTVLTQQRVTVTAAAIENLLPRFTGDILQTPPMYSAVQQNGRRLYDLARKGIEVEREKREVSVHILELVEYDEKNAVGKLRIACSKGTYIRSIIDDIGRELGCGGVMTALCRTSACGYTLEDAITLEQAKNLAEKGEINTVVHSIEGLFTTYQAVQISAPQAVRFNNGGGLDLGRTSLARGCRDNAVYRVKSPDGEFLGLGVVCKEKEELSILKRFNVIRNV
ncbi:MAG TPA: tRNA pseudouridine(55) synthase TruB [Clostridiales bacterium]|nr:tRNA pseudouridine(55) synthase TruB [Clostridiales bacterium]